MGVRSTKTWGSDLQKRYLKHNNIPYENLKQKRGEKVPTQTLN